LLGMSIPPLTSDAHAERTCVLSPEGFSPLSLSGYESKQYLYLPDNCTEVACVPHTHPLDEQNDLPSFGPMDCRGMGSPPHAGCRGGLNIPAGIGKFPVLYQSGSWTGRSRGIQDSVAWGILFPRAR
jgi:hypothetical protein